MTSFEAVKRSLRQVVGPDGRSLRGSAFQVLPSGVLLTCHHVISGVTEIRVRVPETGRVVGAEYVAEVSDPIADIAVLRTSEIGPAVQVARMPGTGRAHGYGFRPGSLQLEPLGHTFTGEYGPGQTLEIPLNDVLLRQLAAVPEGERQQWNVIPERVRAGDVRNFTVTGGGLEPGISGGPVYDADLRKVVGVFRAVEGEAQAYVLPIDVILERWPELEEANRADVPDDALDRLAAEFDIQPVKERGPAVRPIGAGYFESLLRPREPFGGRHQELATLNSFVNESKTPYLFVTGQAGIGKTTLLATWMSSAMPPDTRLAVHFLSRRVEQATDQRFCFENLCEQLMAHQRLGGRLPEGELRLRRLYRQLLQLDPPPGVRIVVVLDGLDEVLTSWTPGPDIFPSGLPPGVRVIFSARRIAEMDWIDALEIDRAASRTLELSRLSRRDVEEVVVRSKLVSEEQRAEVAARIWELSEGDPYYIQDLLGELGTGTRDLAALAAMPVGHSNYLRQWWESAAVGDDAFVDLMGVLTVARAPLARAQLVAISSEDAIRDVTFFQLIGRANRHITGDQHNGYQIGSTRLREFVGAQFGAELEVYERRLADYCRRWSDRRLGAAGRHYALSHAAHHIAVSGSVQELLALLSPEWIAAKWQEQGSFASLIDDLEVVGSAAYGSEPPDVPLVAGVAVARATARSMTHGLPPAILSALARLGEEAQLLGIVGSDKRVGADDPNLEIELLLTAVRELSVIGSDAFSRPELLEDLLAGALNRASAFTTAADQIAVFGAVIDTVAALPARSRTAFIEEAAEFTISDLAGRTAKAVALGLLATAALGSEGGRSLAARLRDRADQLIAAIPARSDHIVAQASLIPVMAVVEGEDAALSLVRELTSGDECLEPSSVSSLCALVVLQQALAAGLPAAALAPWAMALADRCLDRIEELEDAAAVGVLVGRVARWCVETDEYERGEALVERALAANEKAGTAAVLEALEPGCSFPQARALDWLERCAVDAAPVPAVVALVRVGALQCVPERLKAVGLESRARAGAAALIALDESHAVEDDTRVADAVLDLCRGCPQDIYFANLLSAAATVTARGDPARARDLLARAVALCIMPPDRNDLKPLHEVLAAALHEEERYEEAAHVACGIQPAESAGWLLVWLLEHSTKQEHEALRAYGQGLAALLRGPDGRDFLLLEQAAGAADVLHPVFPALACELEDQVIDAVRRTWKVVHEMAPAMRAQPALAQQFGLLNVTAALRLLSATAALVPDEAPAIAADLATIGDCLDDLERVLARARHAAATRDLDPQASELIIEELWETLASPDDSASATALGAISGIAPTAIRAERQRAGRDLAAFLEHARRFARMGVPSAINLFWDAYRAVHETGNADVIRSALAAIEEIPDLDDRSGVAEHAAQALAESGEFSAARAAEALIEGRAHHRTSDILSQAELRARRVTASPFELFYASGKPTSPFAESVVNDVREDGQAGPQLLIWLRALAEDVLLGGRSALIHAGVYTLLYPAWHQGGADLIRSIITCVEDFDHRFATASELLARAGQGSGPAA
jgi:hypothetical protein